MNTPADQGHLTSEGASGSGLGPVEQRDLSTGSATGRAGVAVPVAQPGRGTTNTGGPVSGDHEAISSRVSSEDRDGLILAIAHSSSERNLGPRPWECGPCERAERIADRLLAAGWRPPLPKADLRTWRSLLAGIIDGHFGDDYREQAEAAAEDIIDRGWLDKVAEVGPPEPVATTLRRIITDLESEAMAYCPVGIFGVDVDPVEISQTNRIQAETLREYANRLRGHPALKGEHDEELQMTERDHSLPDSETEKTVADFCAERAQYVTALKQNTDGGADYHRWQGHAEARRQLSERLGREVTS